MKQASTIQAVPKLTATTRPSLSDLPRKKPEKESTTMLDVKSIGKRATWLSMLVVLAAGATLWAAEGGR